MPFFVETPGLLTSDQLTFIGVIATLAVLSVIYGGRKNRRRSHNTNSNLLVDLIGAFKISVDKYLSGTGWDKCEKEIEEIELEIRKDPSIIEFQQAFYEGSSFNINNRTKLSQHTDTWSAEIEILLYKQSIKGILDRLNLERIIRTKKVKDELMLLQSPTSAEQHTPVFMSFYTFILCVAIMLIHFFHFNVVINASLLFLVDVFFSVVLLSSWMVYCEDWLIRENKTGLFAKKSDRNYTDALPYIVIVFVFTFLFVFKSLLSLVVFNFVNATAIGVFFYIRKMKQSERYGIGTMALFAVHGLFIAFIISLFVNCWTIDNLCLYNFFKERLECFRIAFIILCVLNTFILPLVVSYYRYVIKTTRQLKIIVRLYRKGNREAKKVKRMIVRKMKKIQKKYYRAEKEALKKEQREIKQQIRIQKREVLKDAIRRIKELKKQKKDIMKKRESI